MARPRFDERADPPRAGPQSPPRRPAGRKRPSRATDRALRRVDRRRPRPGQAMGLGHGLARSPGPGGGGGDAQVSPQGWNRHRASLRSRRAGHEGRRPSLLRRSPGARGRSRCGFRSHYSQFAFQRQRVERMPGTPFHRLSVKLLYRGRSWATLKLEVAPPEARGVDREPVPAIDIAEFGLDGPRVVQCLSTRFQVAQKVHAVTERFEHRENERFRDLIDLLLLRELVTPSAAFLLRTQGSASLPIRFQRAAATRSSPTFVSGYSSLSPMRSSSSSSARCSVSSTPRFFASLTTTAGPATTAGTTTAR